MAAPALTGRAVADVEVAHVEVVIVSYRCREFVLRCIASLAAAVTTEHRVTITVIDNGSADGTVAAVRADHPHVRVIDLAANTGFAHANNVGIATSAAGGSGYVLVLNPDTVVAPGALSTLIRFAEQTPSAGVVAPALRNLNGTDQLTARAFPTPAAAVFGRRSPLTRLAPHNRWSTRFLTGREHTGPDPFRVDWVSGAAMLVPRRVIDEVGAFDEGFFLFWEDADWCRRIGAASYDVWCVPAATIVHDEGGTRSHGWSAPTIRWFHQGAYRYWVKHHAPSPANPGRWAAAALLTLRAALLTARHASRGRPPLPTTERTDNHEH